MAIDPPTLDALVRRHVASMTSIRGRRVHRLLMREFARFDHVLSATASDGSPALLALALDGSAAVCSTNGRGAAAAVDAWARLIGASVSTRFDLTRDSLPVLSWTIWHPGFDRGTGALTIALEGLTDTDRRQVAGLLKVLAG
ncbi:MAG: hypothetical protein H7Z19_04085 [Chitinophagaceae bacterium]|nr:hypothetical protein [Rubrivivax sp.]